MKHHEHGYILIAMIVTLAAISSVALVRGLNANSRSDAREQRLAMRAMREARMALIGKAMAEDDTAGSMACPDRDRDGIADNCLTPGSEQLGCVPWRTLGIPSADRLGIEPLWYALSYDFGNGIPSYSPTGTTRNSPGMQINIEKLGSLSLSPNYPNAIAVLVAPGPALSTQNRSATDPCGSVVAAKYLEAANALTNGNLITSPHDDTFNDTLMPIVGNDLYRPLINVVLSQFANISITPTPVRGLRWYFDQGNTPNSLDYEIMPAPSAPKVKNIVNRSANSAQFDEQFELTPPPPTTPVAGTYLYPNVKNVSCNVTETLNAGVVTETTGKKASSWLCSNGWYDYIAYRSLDTTSAQLSIALPPSSHSCVLTAYASTAGHADTLKCI